jgi:hypothetical protein
MSIGESRQHAIGRIPIRRFDSRMEGRGSLRLVVRLGWEFCARIPALIRNGRSGFVVNPPNPRGTKTRIGWGTASHSMGHGGSFIEAGGDRGREKAKRPACSQAGRAHCSIFPLVNVILRSVWPRGREHPAPLAPIPTWSSRASRRRLWKGR